MFYNETDLVTPWKLKMPTIVGIISVALAKAYIPSTINMNYLPWYLQFLVQGQPLEIDTK